MSSKRETTSGKPKVSKTNKPKSKKANRTNFKKETWYQSLSGVIGVSASKNPAAPSQ
jgi:hypothetical protein